MVFVKLRKDELELFRWLCGCGGLQTHFESDFGEA